MRPSAGVAVFDADGFAGSLTAGLTEALTRLPDGGALDERRVAFRYRDGAMPDGARPIASRAAVGIATSGAPTQGATSRADAGGDWLQRRTKQLVDAISAPTVSPAVAILALLAAVVLGALHAFAPGHGKTIVGAYLVGSRSTPRHAVFLGATVTITHTLVVFAVGLGTLVASRYVVPETLLPVLSLLSGLLVLGMGLVLLMQRWKPARRAIVGALLHRLEASLDRRDGVRSGPRYRRLSDASPAGYGFVSAAATPRGAHRHAHAPGAGHVHPQDHGHAHADTHSHEHDHAHAHAGLHSHGGRAHSHLPPATPDGRVTWRSLLALGVSGGLVPCPSAMVLLLAAIALGKTMYGLVLVVAFSAGLALTLIAVGLAFLYARRRWRRPARASWWSATLPAASAALIVVVGIVLCYGALGAFVARVPGT